MRLTAAEDRATRGRDPSAVCGAKTQGWAARAPPPFFPPFADSHPSDKSLGDEVAESSDPQQPKRMLKTQTLRPLTRTARNSTSR